MAGSAVGDETRGCSGSTLSGGCQEACGLEIFCEANTQHAFLNPNAPPTHFVLARDLLDFWLFGGVNHFGRWDALCIGLNWVLRRNRGFQRDMPHCHIFSDQREHVHLQPAARIR
jgi:hypothetical protein